MTDSYTFKLGVNLSETGESFERAVELAQELGAGYAEFFVNDRAHLSAAGAAPLPPPAGGTRLAGTRHRLLRPTRSRSYTLTSSIWPIFPRIPPSGTTSISFAGA